MSIPVYPGPSIPMEATRIPSGIEPFVPTHRVAFSGLTVTGVARGSIDATDPGVTITVKCGVPQNELVTFERSKKPPDRDVIETGEKDLVMRVSECLEVFRQSGISVHSSRTFGIDASVASLLERIACREVHEELDDATCIEDMIFSSDGLPPYITEYIQVHSVFRGASPVERQLHSLAQHAAGTQRAVALELVQGFFDAGISVGSPNHRTTKPFGVEMHVSQKRVNDTSTDGDRQIPVFDDKGRPSMTVIVRMVAVPHTASDRAAAQMLMKLLECPADDQFNMYKMQYLGTAGGTQDVTRAPMESVASLVNKAVENDGSAANRNFALTELMMGQFVEGSFGSRPQVTPKAQPGRPYGIGPIMDPFVGGVALKSLISICYTSNNVNYAISNASRFASSPGITPTLEQWNSGMQVVPNNGHMYSVENMPRSEARIHRDEQMLVANQDDLIVLGHATREELQRARWVQLLRSRKVVHPLALRGIASAILTKSGMVDATKKRIGPEYGAKYVAGQYHFMCREEPLLKDVRDSITDEQVASLSDSRTLGIVINDTIAKIHATVEKNIVQAVMKTALFYKDGAGLEGAIKDLSKDSYMHKKFIWGSKPDGSEADFSTAEADLEDSIAAVFDAAKIGKKTCEDERDKKKPPTGIARMLGLSEFFKMARKNYSPKSTREFMTNLVEFVLAYRCHVVLAEHVYRTVKSLFSVGKFTKLIDELPDDYKEALPMTDDEKKKARAAHQDGVQAALKKIEDFARAFKNDDNHSVIDLAMCKLLVSLVISAKEEFIYNVLANPVPQEKTYSKSKAVPVVHTDIPALLRETLKKVDWFLVFPERPGYVRLPPTHKQEELDRANLFQKSLGSKEDTAESSISLLKSSFAKRLQFMAAKKKAHADLGDEVLHGYFYGVLHYIIALLHPDDALLFCSELVKDTDVTTFGIGTPPGNGGGGASRSIPVVREPEAPLADEDADGDFLFGAAPESPEEDFFDRPAAASDAANYADGTFDFEESRTESPKKRKRGGGTGGSERRHKKPSQQ